MSPGLARSSSSYLQRADSRHRPADLRVMSGHRPAWPQGFVTSDMKNITLTSAGRNLINFHLPKKTKKPA